MMTTPHDKLTQQGYTAEEAELVLHVLATANADRQHAKRTGLCRCGRPMTRGRGTLSCVPCHVVHAA